MKLKWGFWDLDFIGCHNLRSKWDLSVAPKSRIGKENHMGRQSKLKRLKAMNEEDEVQRRRRNKKGKEVVVLHMNGFIS